MKHLMLLLLLCVPPPSHSQVTQHFFKIPANTVIRVRTVDDVSSEAAHVGDVVPMEVLSDVIVTGFVVVRQGAPAVGEISRVKEARSMGRRGKVALTMSYVEAVTGEHVLVGGNRAQQGEGKAAKLTAEIALTTAATGGLIGALWLFEKGHETSIPPGTAFSTYTTGDTTIDLSLLSAAAGLSTADTSSPSTADHQVTGDASLLSKPMANGSMDFPTLGLVVKTKINRGAEVIGVTRGSAADQVGLQTGDIISEIEGNRVLSVRDMVTFVNRTPGPTLHLSWLMRTNLGWMPTPERTLTLAKARP